MTPETILRERMRRAQRVAKTAKRYEVRLRAEGRVEAYRTARRLLRNASAIRYLKRENTTKETICN